MANGTSEEIKNEIPSIFRSDNFDDDNITQIFDPNFLDDFAIMLDEKTKGDNSISRADAAYEMGLTPYLKILPKADEQELKSRCEKDFLEAAASLHLLVKEGELVEEPKGEKKAQLQALRELKNFDEFDNYREARSRNMGIEAILGLLVSRDIIPGFGLQKGPSGGIRRSENISAPKDRKPGSVRVKSKYPNGFLQLAEATLNKLLPVRANAGVAPKYFKRGQVCKAMGFDWVGGEYENMLSNAIGQNAIAGFDIAAGANKGVFRLAPGESQKEKKSKKTDVPATTLVTPPVPNETKVETEVTVQEKVTVPVEMLPASVPAAIEEVISNVSDESMVALPDEDFEEEVSIN